MDATLVDATLTCAHACVRVWADHDEGAQQHGLDPLGSLMSATSNNTSEHHFLSEPPCDTRGPTRS